jgi:hypothetical protein
MTITDFLRLSTEPPFLSPPSLLSPPLSYTRRLFFFFFLIVGFYVLVTTPYTPSHLSKPHYCFPLIAFPMRTAVIFLTFTPSILFFFTTSPLSFWWPSALYAYPAATATATAIPLSLFLHFGSAAFFRSRCTHSIFFLYFIGRVLCCTIGSPA